MNDFETFSYNEVCAALRNIDAQIRPDIYALSFYVFYMDDDSRFPVLQLGYNTRARVAECAPGASGVEEATWNFAFWLQNELKCIGGPGTEGGYLLETVLRAEGLWYSDEEEESDFDRCMEIADNIATRFTKSCVRIAQALHADGIIDREFSGPVPIIVHELEYYDEIAAQTRSANPAGLAKGFEEWIASLYFSRHMGRKR